MYKCVISNAILIVPQNGNMPVTGLRTVTKTTIHSFMLLFGHILTDYLNKIHI